MLEEEFNSTLFTFLDFNFGEFFEKSSPVDFCFAHSGSYGHGFVTRSVLLDSALGVYAFLPLLAILVGYLFYLVVYRLYPFFYQVGPFHFVVFSLFQLSFLVAVC